MAETADTIRSKDVDGGAEAIFLDILKRVEVLEARPAGRQITQQTIEYEEGAPDVYRLDPVAS